MKAEQKGSEAGSKEDWPAEDRWRRGRVDSSGMVKKNTEEGGGIGAGE